MGIVNLRKKAMKDFNLEECIAGKPVVTRDGRPYKFGAYSPDVPKWKLAGWINGQVFSHTAEGKWDDGRKNDSDLIMASCKKEGWINIYTDPLSNPYYGIIHPNEHIAQIQGNKVGHLVATIHIEWEE